jgi:hypothetical protein
LAEEELKNLNNPAYEGQVDYGGRAEYFMNGDIEIDIFK